MDLTDIQIENAEIPKNVDELHNKLVWIKFSDGCFYLAYVTPVHTNIIDAWFITYHDCQINDMWSRVNVTLETLSKDYLIVTNL